MQHRSSVSVCEAQNDLEVVQACAKEGDELSGLLRVSGDEEEETLGSRRLEDVMERSEMWSQEEMERCCEEGYEGRGD